MSRTRRRFIVHDVATDLVRGVCGINIRTDSRSNGCPFRAWKRGTARSCDSCNPTRRPNLAGTMDRNIRMKYSFERMPCCSTSRRRFPSKPDAYPLPPASCKRRRRCARPPVLRSTQKQRTKQRSGRQCRDQATGVAHRAACRRRARAWAWSSRGRGLGELADAVRRILTAGRSLAEFAIIVIAKDERAVAFYESFGFRPFSSPASAFPADLYSNAGPRPCIEVSPCQCPSKSR
jgi:hypothetical protein